MAFLAIPDEPALAVLLLTLFLITRAKIPLEPPTLFVLAFAHGLIG